MKGGGGRGKKTPQIYAYGYYLHGMTEILQSAILVFKVTVFLAQG